MLAKRYKIFIITLFVFISCKANENPLNKSDQSAAYTIKSITMFSPTVNDTIVIDISLPANYNSDTLRYPVLYMTDGYWRRGQHVPIHEMAKSDTVREMIIVGIGYPAGYDPNIIRVRDLVRSPDRFLDFIVTVLIPKIEKEYRTTTERTLWGSSFGGFFGMYALFCSAEKTNGVFKNYIIASPAALETSNCTGTETNLFGFENMLWKKSAQLNTNLYITVGGIEDPVRFLNPFVSLVNLLEGRHYAGFFMKSYIDPGKDHFTVWEPSLYEGIRIFFKK